MNSAPLIQYVGFSPRARVREYTFRVRESGGEPREFTLTIANDAFLAHRARYQDAPDICSLKLQRELAAAENHPPATHFRISDAELADYVAAHTPPSARRHLPKA